MSASDGHVIDSEWEGACAFDKCALCGKPIDYRAGALVNMLDGNAECYGR